VRRVDAAVPADAIPGRYRLRKGVLLARGPWQEETAEFDVVAAGA
jgi:hypothetical protein